MSGYVFPRKPYDEVESPFVRDQIRQGSFWDLPHRRYVNELVWLEWYTRDLDRSTMSGVSAFGCAVHHYQIATRWPDAYDAVRQDLDATTRAEFSWRDPDGVDPEARQRWARRHAGEWAAVREDDHRPRSEAETLTDRSDRPRFARFRFPIIPYDTVQSTFLREEIQRGSFDDLQHRRYVNKLVWLEWAETIGQDELSSLYGPITRKWKIAATLPEAFDILMREIGGSTRDSLSLDGEIHYGDIDAEAKRRDLARAWQAVTDA